MTPDPTRAMLGAYGQAPEPPEPITDVAVCVECDGADSPRNQAILEHLRRQREKGNA